MALDRDAAYNAANETAHTVIDLITPVGLFSDTAAKKVHDGLTSIGESLGMAAYDAVQATKPVLSRATNAVVSSARPVLRASASEAVKGAQRLLQVAGSPGLRVDGIVGPQTIAALNRAPQWAKTAVEQFVITKGFTAQGLFAPLRREIQLNVPAVARTAAKAATLASPAVMAATQLSRVLMDSKGPFTTAQLDTIINRARGDAPSDVRNKLVWLNNSDVIAKILIESAGKADAVSRSRDFHGLLQMGHAAWADALRLDPKLPSFTAGRYDAYWNVRAALAFWSGLVRQSATRGIAVDTWEKLYAAHQQGAGGFNTLVKSKATPAQIRSGRTGIGVVDNQSRPSLDIVARAVEQVRAIA